jgi:hypothetical protein
MVGVRSTPTIERLSFLALDFDHVDEDPGNSVISVCSVLNGYMPPDAPPLCR